MDEQYELTDLTQNEELIQEIRKLEEKLEQHIGDKVNLIAYSPTKE